MVDSQTFIIMREPKAVAGAKRVTGDPKLQAVFRAAAAASGFPQDVLEAIAYLESWGDVSAESWAGSPRGSCRSHSPPRAPWDSKWARSPVTVPSR